MVAGSFTGFGETEVVGLSYRFLVTHGLLCFVPALLPCIIVYEGIAQKEIKGNMLRQCAEARESEA